VDKQNKVVTKNGKKVVEEVTTTEVTKEQLVERLEQANRQIANMTERKNEPEALIAKL
jgi:benzoyl-CoA reductase/2-hydroxyglutaryl-CoA dehydratase subunit BcrC/BadD/HgdB